MLNIQRTASTWGGHLRKAVAAALLLAGSGAAMAVDLCALAGNTGAAGLPANTTVYGYAATCATAPTVPGGPTIFANVGDTVSVTLTNNLPVATGLLFQGQALPYDASGVAPGASKTYTFTASQPGTYLYEAAPIPGTEYQVAMGLYGALVVRPAVAGQAYDNAASAYDDEAVLLLGELDTALNNSATPANFDMRKFAPRYFLINGKPYPNTDAIVSNASATLGKKLLLRYLNAGAKHHSMGVLGLRQVFVAKDGNPLPQLNNDVVAETLAPGQTADAILSVPAVATATKYAVYDASLSLHNNGSSTAFGGMLAFIGAGTGASTDGPVVTAMSYAGGLLTATIQATSPRTVTGAEYWLDAGAHTPLATTGAVSVAVAAPTSTGTHVLYLRGQDDQSTWGATRSVSFAIDATGPAITGLTLTPNANGSVSLTASADDSASGGANVVAAQYSVDGGAFAAANLGGVAAPVRAVTATTAVLAAGPHSIALQAQDAAGNWGAPSSAAVTVGAVPTVSNVTVQKSPNNGTVPLSASQQVVRVTATIAGAGGTVAGAEGFIDSNSGATGTGFPFLATDGAWGGASEAAYADIPLSSMATLGNGPHTIYVRGRNAQGLWGAFAAGTLVIDKTAPSISAMTLTPSAPLWGQAVSLTVTAADNIGGVGLSSTGQYWIDGSATPPANPTSFVPGSGVTLGSLSVGVHTIYARVQDAASNWSPVASAVLTVAPAPVDDAKTITANGTVTQGTNYGAAAGLLVNDLPNVAGRTVRLASAPVRLTGSGTGTLTVTCQGGAAGTAATPAIGGNTVCTNGAFRIVLGGVGGTAALRAASKRGTFSFTYTETLNGVTSAPATVTITVN